ncbi:hypothetical protein ACJJTC_003090 [Scirpophaga incertulas]
MMIKFRFFHTSSRIFSLKKQALRLNKMINPNPKKQWYPKNSFDFDILPSVKSLAKTKNEPGKRAGRRVAMLNKVFMKHITDLMSTGTVAMDILGRGIEISKVQVTSDYRNVNVYWVCKGTSTDEDIEIALKKISGVLRHELSVLRIMGEIPSITFLKDKQEANVAQLDTLLSIADYGEDYEATELGHILKTEFILNSKLSPEMKLKIKKLEEDLPLEEDPIPEMTHSVYGLDHAKIMNRLLAARKKTRDAWASVTDGTVQQHRAVEANSIETDIDQRKELADFLLKRKIQQKKIHKEMLNAREDLLQHKLDSQSYDSNDENQNILDDEEEDDDYDYYEEDDSPSQNNNI